MELESLPPFATAREVADATGLAEKQVRRLARAGKFGALPDAGRYMRIRRDGVIAWGAGQAASA